MALRPKKRIMILFGGLSREHEVSLNPASAKTLFKCKKIMDVYVHEIKVLDDSVDVVFKISLGADKGGVGGGT